MYLITQAKDGIYTLNLSRYVTEFFYCFNHGPVNRITDMRCNSYKANSTE